MRIISTVAGLQKIHQKVRIISITFIIRGIIRQKNTHSCKPSEARQPREREGMKEVRKEGRREGRTDGRMEGRGRKERRTEGRKDGMNE